VVSLIASWAAARQIASDLQFDRSAMATFWPRLLTSEYLAMAWESGQPEVFGGIGLGRSSALHSTPGYPV
jgi:hypothetical protein